MESGTTTGIRVHNIRLDGSNMLFDVEYITEPSNKITAVTLNNKLLTITTNGLTGKNLEIGFNNKDYVSFEVSSNVMTIDLSDAKYVDKFDDNIKVNNNGFNILNIRAAANSFTNDISQRPFNYNYTFEFI
jgi:hypothetical protein